MKSFFNETRSYGVERPFRIDLSISAQPRKEIWSLHEMCFRINFLSYLKLEKGSKLISIMFGVIAILTFQCASVPHLSCFLWQPVYLLLLISDLYITSKLWNQWIEQFEIEHRYNSYAIRMWFTITISHHVLWNHVRQLGMASKSLTYRVSPKKLDPHFGWS